MWLDLHQGREERTFRNKDRLSPEGLESEPYELKLDDIVVSLQLYSDLSFYIYIAFVTGIRN